MIPLHTGFATLTTFDPRDLLAFAMKLLDLPAEATHLLRRCRVVLRHVVSGDIVRALGREHQPEKFHPMAFGKVLYDPICFSRRGQDHRCDNQ